MTEYDLPERDRVHGEQVQEEDSCRVLRDLNHERPHQRGEWPELFQDTGESGLMCEAKGTPRKQRGPFILQQSSGFD